MTRHLTLVDLILYSGAGDEGILYDYLVNGTGGYNNKVRPLLNHSQPVIVNIDFQLLSIIDLVSIKRVQIKLNLVFSCIVLTQTQKTTPLNIIKAFRRMFLSKIVQFYCDKLRTT